MRLASTTLQDASQAVLSTHNQFEVRSFLALDDPSGEPDSDDFKVFDDPHAVNCPIP